MIKANFTKLLEDAILPTQEYHNDAGVDFYLREDIVIAPKENIITDLGIGWSPEWAFINNQEIGIYQRETYANISNFFRNCFKFTLIAKSRSGRTFLDGLDLPNSGVVDEGYRDSIKLKIYNNSNVTRYYYKGDKIAQGLIIIQPKIIDIIPKKSGNRNKAGFGSTGEKVE